MSLRLEFYKVLEHLVLDIETRFPGQGVTAIYGPSGCGKTSLLRAIAGLDRYQGLVSFNEQIWQNDEFYLPTEKRRIGLVFQDSQLFPHLTVRQNIEFGYHQFSKNNRSKPLFALSEVADLLGVSPLLAKNVQYLSGGEKQRVAIARAIMSQPQLLLMDEPLASLDQPAKKNLLPYLEIISEKFALPVIYVSHSEEEIARLADYLLVMAKGKIVAQGALMTMLASLDSPFARLDSAFGLLDLRVSNLDTQFQLATLSHDGLSLQIDAHNLQMGQPVRVRILAKDVSLCLTPAQDTSILNLLPANIVEIRPEGNSAHCLVGLSLGSGFISARISNYSREKLKLHLGQQVFAQVKAMALVK